MTQPRRIETEQQALEALEAVLRWCHAKPESTAYASAITRTAQRGRVTATRRLQSGTLYITTHTSPEEARAPRERPPEAPGAPLAA